MTLRRVPAHARWLLALVVTGAVIAGTATATAARTGAGNYTVVYRTPSDFLMFDLQRNHNINGVGGYVLPLYDRLAMVGPQNKVLPWVAKSWVITPKSVTFKLRTDVKCADGTKLTPVAVLNSFKRLFSVPKQTNNIPGNFGPGPFHLSADRFKGTFTIRSETPYRNMIYGVTLPWTGIVCPAGLAAVANDAAALETQVYGSGPYTLVSAAHGDQVVYRKRSDYTWGPPGTTPIVQLPDTLIAKVVSNETTAANLLITGGLDVAMITGVDVERLVADKSLVHKQLTSFAAAPLVFNMRPGRVTTELAVRQALSIVIDRKNWNQAALSGLGTVTASLIAPGSECYDPAIEKLAAPPNMARARQVLQSAGWQQQGGHWVKDGRTLSIRLPNTPLHGRSGEYLQSVWNQLGVDVDLADTDHGTYATAIVGGNFDAGVLTVPQAAPVPAPGAQLAFTSGSPPPAGFNVAATGIGDLAYTKLVRAAFQNVGARSCKLFSELMKMELEKYYVVPLSAPNLQWFSRGLDFLPTTYAPETLFLKRAS
jgi:peptide/nickel transport system substrate-binding protein